jgi:hypothetical protein
VNSERIREAIPVLALPALALALFGGYKLAMFVTSAGGAAGVYTGQPPSTIRDKGPTRVVTVEKVVTAAPKTVRATEYRTVPARGRTTRVVTLTNAVTVPRRVTVAGQTQLVTVRARRLTVTEVRRIPDEARTVTERQYVTVTAAAGPPPAARTITVQRGGRTVTTAATVTTTAAVTSTVTTTVVQTVTVPKGRGGQGKR